MDEGICRLDLRITGRAKTSALLVAAPFVMLPHAPGLSHTLPADNCYICVRLDWVIHTNLGIGVQHGLEGSQEGGPVALTWDAKSYDAGSLKTCIAIEPSQTEVTLITG